MHGEKEREEARGKVQEYSKSMSARDLIEVEPEGGLRDHAAFSALDSREDAICQSHLCVCGMLVRSYVVQGGERERERKGGRRRKSGRGGREEREERRDREEEGGRRRGGGTRR